MNNYARFLNPTVLEVGLAAESDACDTNNHKEIDDRRRSSAYSANITQDRLCDNNLQEGWYRFTSSVGGEMPDTCVPKKHVKCLLASVFSLLVCIFFLFLFCKTPK